MFITDVKSFIIWAQSDPAESVTAKGPTLTPKKQVLDLIEVKRRLDEGHYSNVLDFHLDIKKVRNSAKIGGPAKKRILAKFDEVPVFQKLFSSLMTV